MNLQGRIWALKYHTLIHGSFWHKKEMKNIENGLNSLNCYIWENLLLYLPFFHKYNSTYNKIQATISFIGI